MNRSQLVALAGAVQSLRPDWQQPGIVAQLQQLDQGWTGTDAGLSAFAMQVAGDPAARTPAAFNATPQPVAQPRQSWVNREPVCYTCGRRRSGCMAYFDLEIARGLPDPHDFETAESAELRSAGRQLGGAA